MSYLTISRENVEFFLEIKSSSPTLIDLIAEKIKKEKLWKRIHIMGFSLMVRNAIKAQRKHPELKIGQLLNFPPLAYIKKPKKSYSIFLGWLDGLRGSQTLFRLFFPPKRLTKFKNFLEKHGFKVMGGVINNKEGLDLFAQAGITDIVTDKVAETVAYFKRNN